MFLVSDALASIPSALIFPVWISVILPLSKQKSKHTWLAGSITRQAHLAFSVKFFIIYVVLFLFKG